MPVRDDLPTPGHLVELRDGATIALVPMAPDHADGLVRFHEGLSLDATYRRFFSPHPHLSEREVDHFTHVDHVHREAIVALSRDDIIGVARFECLTDPTVAEVAFAVADGWQGKGVGRVLFEELAARAHQLGIGRFSAETLWENAPMLGLFRNIGRPMTTRAEGAVVHVELDLGRDLRPGCS